MLLEFKTKNYKSFKDELVFSMIPAPKQKGLDYSVLREKAGGKERKALSSAVIYGPNASGKTNIIGAMDAFKCIVLRGNIRNDDDKGLPNKAAHRLELIPNIGLSQPQPVSFAIRFITDGLLISYSFSLDIGKFLDVDYHRSILSETLTINDQLIFQRENGLQIGNLGLIRPYLANALESNLESAIALSESSLNREELFLMNGFKTMFSARLVAKITTWLERKFMIIYHADAVQTIQRTDDFKQGTVYINQLLAKAASSFGINSNTIGYAVRDDENDPQLCSVFTKGSTVGKNVLMPADLFESYGTIRFVNLFPLVANALLIGGTLVVDEFDASIHPMALMNLINIVHNDEINRNHAQLIFNTHNPIFLNSNLYRRDEIKFVDRYDETHNSVHYALSDFGTTGPSGVRQKEDYMKNYFVDRYGAIKDIDFTPIFEELMNQQKEG